MTRITVDLGPRSYPIDIGSNLLEVLGQRVREVAPAKRCALITDDRVGPLYADKAVDSLKSADYEVEIIQVASGEGSKRLSVVGEVYDTMAAARLERKSPVIALGGGVVGDLAGFVAASYLRGVPFVQAPTTLLAQVDSSVGGKVGVNLPAGKNLVGAFYQPKIVVCDLDSLSSLPEREYRAGLAEVIKYGVIEDRALFERLEDSLGALNSRSMEVLTPVIARCCEIKASVAQRDEQEGGLRQILNFGHTIGHAIEAVAGYGEYLHGEAISIGMVKAAVLSEQLRGLPRNHSERIARILQAVGLPTSRGFDEEWKQGLRAAMALDKKVADGVVRFVLAEQIGSVVFGEPVPPDELDRVLTEDQSELTA